MRRRWLVVLCTIISCDGSTILQPVTLPAEPAPVRPEGVFPVEPFEYHFPDEPFFDATGDTLELYVARGESERASVVVTGAAADTVVLRARGLKAEGGLEVPDQAFALGVVTRHVRERPTGFPGIDGDRLAMPYLGGRRLGDTSDDFRGLNEDAREGLPLVPLVIVSSTLTFGAAAAEGLPIQTSELGTSASASLQDGAVQFWVTFSCPADLDLAGPETTFSGSFEVVRGGVTEELAVVVHVVDTQLDALAEHDKGVGAFLDVELDASGAWDTNLLEDLVKRGANAVVLSLSSAESLAATESLGFSEVFLDREPLDTSMVAEIANDRAEASLPPPRVLVGSYEPTTAEVAEDGARASAWKDAGAWVGGAMTLSVLNDTQAISPLDFWIHALSTYELDTKNKPQFSGFLDHLDSLRTAEQEPLALREYHYAEVFNGYSMLEARLFYGLFLYGSGFDGALAYGYYMQNSNSPLTDSSHHGVVFPAESPSGVRFLLSTPTADAFSEGLDDLRYALTVARLLEAHGSPEQRARFLTETAEFARLYVGTDRLDYRKRARDVAATKRELHSMLVDLLAASP